MNRHNLGRVALCALGLALSGLVSSAFRDRLSAQVAPNVVIVMTDDQNVDSLPVMRNLLSFPEGSWVNFTNAIANDSICCPARATVLTGQYAYVTGVLNNASGDRLNDANTLPVWLDAAGYRTALIGKYLNGYPWDRGATYIPPGWDYFRASGLGKSDERTRLAIDFINQPGGPFFVYLAFSEPHWPTTPLPQYSNENVFVPPDPPNFNESDVSDKPAWIRNLSPLSQSTIDQWRNERVASQRSLLGVDDGIQRIIDALKMNGQLDNTLIIFMSDHGFSWGSHRHLKKECVYEECIRFPLFIRYPGLAGTREETRVVSNVDIASTIAEYVGVVPGLPQNGRSLIPVITNTAVNWTEEAFIEVHLGPARTFDGIRVPGWTYAEYGNGNKELYDLAVDPHQLENRANVPAYQAVQDDLARRLRDLKPTNTPPPPDLIHADGFESGNFAAWSATTADSGDLSVNGGAALIGSLGMQAMIDDNNAIYVTDDLPAAESHYRARFYFDPNSITMARNNAHFIFDGIMGTSRVVMRIEFRQSAGAYQVRGRLISDGSSWTDSSWFTINDASHLIELEWRSSTAAGANDGGLTLWIDGIQQASLTSVDNDSRRIDRVKLGAGAGIDSGTRGVYFFDAFESRRQTYIGP